MELKSMIMQLYDGETGNFDVIKYTEEYHRLFRTMLEKEEQLKAKLETLPELLDLYKETIYYTDELRTQGNRDIYADAFRLGFNLALDALGILKDDELQH